MELEGHVAGVELGGTKCILVLANAGGEILDQRSLPTRMPRETLAGIEAVLDEWWGDDPTQGGFAALGIASFGPVGLDATAPDWGYITATAKPGWRNTSICPRLAARYPVPTAFDTDVNGAALAEQRWGAAQNLADFAYVTVGTGVGVGLIVNGMPTRGLGHCEAGHMHVARLPGDDWPGACPYHGACVEGLAAGPAIAARLGVAGETVSHDDPVWDSVVEALAQMMQAIIFATAPRRFLVGGGVMAHRPDLIARLDARVRQLVGSYLPLPSAETDYVTAPGLGTRAGPLGPIALALGLTEHG